MKRDLAEINRKTPSGRTKQSGTNGTWNRKQATFSQMWINAEADITQKTSRSNEIRDLRRVASAVTSLPASQMAESPFLKALGPAQTGERAQRAVEEWERNVCEKTKLWQS